MISLPYDHRMITRRHQLSHRPMRHVHQRARRFHHPVASRCHFRHSFVGCSMRRDQNLLRFHRARILRDLDAPRLELRQNRFIVDQISQNRQWLFPGLFQRQRNGVPHAKAHPQVICFNNSHISLCATKYVTTPVAFSFKHFYLGLFCWMIFSSRLM
jgi:hypothetical protein